MTQKTDLHVFPFIPDQIVSTTYHQFEDFDIASFEDMNKILVFMFEHPEHEFYYFTQQGTQINTLLSDAISDNWILATTIENHYYQHPNYKSKFINVKGGYAKTEKENNSIQNKHPYTRFTLTLTEKCKRKFEIDQLIYAQSKLNENPLELKPNFLGFGVDLLKLSKWIKSIFSKSKI